MATKKKGKKAPAKKADKKSAVNKTVKKARSKKEKKEKVPYTPHEDRIVYFMNSLIQAGYVGKTIPEDSKGRKVAALAIRQTAQQLDRQVHRTVT